MANEITLSVSLAFAKGNVPSTSLVKNQAQVTVSGSNCIHDTQVIGTSEEAIVLGEIGTPGYCMMHNCDATNYITIRPATGVTTGSIKLKAGEWALFRFATAAPFAIANTGSCVLEKFLIED